MIFIKPKKGKKRNLHQVFSYIIWNTNMQNPHHWKKKKNKINKIKMVSSSRSSLSFMKELKWNRRHDFCYTLYTQTGDKLKLEVVFVGGGGGGGEGWWHWTAAKHPLERDTSRVRRLSNGEGGRQVITWRTWCRETCNRQRLKMVKSNRSWERERSVMYNIIYTLQLGLHLELRTSPKEVTF